MNYVCGMSGNKIVHKSDCRYVKMIPEKNKRTFETLEIAYKSGYSECKYCSNLLRHLREEEDQLGKYCKPRGIRYYLCKDDGSWAVISHSGRWKIAEGSKEYFRLYHNNNSNNGTKSRFIGYHKHNEFRKDLISYMKYIDNHDRYREADPLYANQKNIKGKKKNKKLKRLEEKMRREREIKYVRDLLNSMSEGKIPY